MAGFDTVQLLAHARHREARAKANGASSATALLQAATDLTEIQRQAVSPDDPLLCGGEAILDPTVPAIFYKNSVVADLAAFYQAHEFGHHWLDGERGACARDDIDEAAPEDRVPLGIERVEGYSSRERRECQANVFAREFLLPSSEARRLFVDEHASAETIAAQIGVPLNLVCQQLAYGLLLPEIQSAVGPSPLPPQLDESQRKAAEAGAGPLLIEAGPGTGKTRTLVARIVWLCGRSANPASILALTFSNKAAEEIRERVAVALPEAAAAIWTGTFHAFGLEIVRKYGHFIDVPPDTRVLDPTDALLLLESELTSLPLNHYLVLYEPAIALRDILMAISRAKDELHTPAKYLELGNAMLARAGDEEARVAAEKVIEVARVYEIYEQILRRGRAVDFADLIVKSVAVLRDQPSTLEAIRDQYRHVLVDEYQDVNRASGIFLRLLSGDGSNLWAVGDARQSIYRFRGASPVNIRAFEADFPGARRFALSTNYRSQTPIVRLVEGFAAKMRGDSTRLSAKWTSYRGEDGGEIQMHVAVDRSAEAAGIGREITRHRAGGVPYCDQALLCRSHANLARFAELLESEGIPVLYLGDLFERPEVRDLLSLVSLTCEPKRGGLLRVATFPEYSVPLEDVRAALEYARVQGITPVEVLRRLDQVAPLTGAGRRGLTLLSEHLDGISFNTPAAHFVSTYLFSRSRYLDRALARSGVTGQQERLALFQFLQFVFEHKSAERGDPKRGLLRRVRRLEAFGEERQLRQLPAAAAGIDAVRLMTVHASKGLEFRIVYLPALGATIFPVSAQYNPCPAPVGMLEEDPAESHHDEEESLFFVALSRARDHLCLSRAEQYGVSRKPSSLLISLKSQLPRPPDATPTWRYSGPDTVPAPPQADLAVDSETHEAEDLDQYLRCPRSYLYQRILQLSGARSDNSYLQFHRCVYAVLRWMDGLPDGTSVINADALAKLADEWKTMGPAGHPFAPMYLKAATSMVERAVARRANISKPPEAVWEIPRPAGTIRVKPDVIEITGREVVVRRLRTGRPPKEIDDDIYALYHIGARQYYPGKQRRIDALYLSTDEARPVSMTDKVLANRLKKYDDAMQAIRAGQFPPKTSERDCPRCPQYFICPGLPRSAESARH
ncbi:MAG: UvrD-helicase domain-containing protein [Candidatus Binataceae bacterium]